MLTMSESEWQALVASLVAKSTIPAAILYALDTTASCVQFVRLALPGSNLTISFDTAPTLGQFTTDVTQTGWPTAVQADGIQA